MSHRDVRSRVAAAFAALPLAAAGGPALAATCTAVNGHSLTTVVPCPPQEPGPLCTRGKVIGGLQGRLDVRAFTVEPAHPSVPSVVRFTGQSVITARDGDTLVGTDVGAIDLDPAGDGHVGTLLTWTGGTGRYAGASGHIVINGHLDFTTGTVATDYRGEVCAE
jgi:hypothetical protein